MRFRIEQYQIIIALVVSTVYGTCLSAQQNGIGLNEKQFYHSYTMENFKPLFNIVETNFIKKEIRAENLFVPPIRPSVFIDSYNYNDLALFCKLDVKLEKAARFPLKFRLGEVQYVDQLEGKY